MKPIESVADLGDSGNAILKRILDDHNLGLPLVIGGYQLPDAALAVILDIARVNAEYHRKRAHAGRAAAVKMGRTGGRKPALSTAVATRAFLLHRDENWTIRALAERFGVSPSAMARVIKERAEILGRD